MGMTPDERATHDLIVKTLGEEGHGTYAKYFNLFDLHLMDNEAMGGTDENPAIAFMVPDTGDIYLNKDVKDLDTVTLLMRHEMLHEYLKHGRRHKDYLRKKLNLPDDEEPPEQEVSKSRRLSNTAGDWELSKFYAPESDFYKAKAMKFKDKILQGLVLELDKPEWLDLTYEQILAELEKERDDLMKSIQSDSDSTEGSENKTQEQQIQDILNKIEKIKQQLGDSKEKTKKAGQQGNNQGKDKNPEQKSSDNPDSSEDNADSEKGNPAEKNGSGNDIVKREVANSVIQDLLDQIQDIIDDADELSDEAKELLKDFKQRPAAFRPGKKKLNKPSKSSSKGVGGGGTTNNDYEGREARLKEIKDFFNDIQQEKAFVDETQQRIFKEKQAQILRKKAVGDREARKSLKTSIGQLRTIRDFKIDLDRAVRKQISPEGKWTDTYTKPNLRTFGTGMIRPGKTQLSPKKHTPVFSVYYDISGSFNNPKKYQAAADAVNTIQKKYEDKGLIKVNLFYHESGADVFTDRSEKNKVGENLVEHISKTRPDNVIIITDSDPEWTCNVPYTADVKGYVQMLFPSTETSPTLGGHIKGKSSKYYSLDI